MKSVSFRYFAVLLLAVALACVGCSDADTATEQSAVKGQVDLIANKAAGKPVVLDFGKGQCGQCIKQAAAIEEVKPQCDGEVDFQFVHIGKEPALAGVHQIFMIPTLIFLDAKGEEVYRSVGVLDAEGLREQLEKLGWAEF